MVTCAALLAVMNGLRCRQLCAKEDSRSLAKADKDLKSFRHGSRIMIKDNSYSSISYRESRHEMVQFIWRLLRIDYVEDNEIECIAYKHIGGIHK